MQAMSTTQHTHFGFNTHPLTGGLVGAILGGLGAGLMVGVPLLLLRNLGSVPSAEELRSAYGISAGEMMTALMSGSVFLAALCALSGAIGGAVAGATTRPTSIEIGLGTIIAGMATGILVALWGATSAAVSWETTAMLFLCGGGMGAVAGCIGSVIGGLLSRKVAGT